jgi:hypothetical protein
MKLILALSAVTLMLTPGIVLAQRAPLTDKEAPPPDATAAPDAGRSAASPEGPVGTSGHPSDMKGTPSMAPSSGNSPSGEPDPGLGRGNK